MVLEVLVVVGNNPLPPVVGNLLLAVVGNNPLPAVVADLPVAAAKCHHEQRIRHRNLEGASLYAPTCAFIPYNFPSFFATMKPSEHAESTINNAQYYLISTRLIHRL
jgi:hypothetical protein